MYIRLSKVEIPEEGSERSRQSVLYRPVFNMKTINFNEQSLLKFHQLPSGSIT